jgi:hypothetical protein
MLAYIFWHIPKEGTDPEEYESSLTGFHAALSNAPPEGFHASAIFRHYALPWAPSSLFVYEDWYLVDGFAALGILNDAAIEGRRRAAHDEAAARAAWGAGGVYRPVDGEAASLSGGFSYWLAKPDGLGYEAFYDELGTVKQLWRRQMVLSPAPEFCLLAGSRLEVGFDVFESSAHTVYTRFPEKP